MMNFTDFIKRQEQVSNAYRNLRFFPKQRILYSVIQKNACTSLFTAFVSRECDVPEWFLEKNRIHNFQQIFWTHNSWMRNDFESMKPGTHKIIAFRDPYERLYSIFTDKLIVPRLAVAEVTKFFENVIRKSIQNCTVTDIVKVVDSFPAVGLEQHFAPQTDCIFFKQYDTVLLIKDRLETIEVNGKKYKLEQSNRVASKYGQEHDNIHENSTIGDLRRFTAETGSLPSRRKFAEIINTQTKESGNFKFDLQLWQHVSAQ
jgi:hypothetical protein